MHSWKIWNCYFLGGKVKSPTWNTFIKPFHKNLWIFIILTNLVLSFCLWIFINHKSHVLSFDESMWITTLSLFGISFNSSIYHNANESGRIVLFITNICGSILFYGYLAYLTSALAIPTAYVPFQSPEELLHTDYKYNAFIMKCSNLVALKELIDRFWKSFVPKQQHSKKEFFR